MISKEEFKRKVRIGEIKTLLPKGILLGEHLISLSNDNDTLESMLYDLNTNGSDAFLESLPFASLDAIAEGIRVKFGSKPDVANVDKLPTVNKNVMISDLSRADKLECIKNLLPKRTIQKAHLACITDDMGLINKMLYDLNWMGTDAFLQRFPDHSLDIMVEALHEMYGGKLPSIKEAEANQQEFIPQKWEYLTLQVHRMSPLNSYGREGWELVTIVGDTFYFKRPCNG